MLDSYSREALDHAWRWFELHARQRLQLVNFFLLSEAFLGSAYALALDAGRPIVSCAFALIGALTPIYFCLIEQRVRALLKAGEQAMEPFEEALASSTGTRAIRLVKGVEQPEARVKYSTAIRFIHATFGIGFALAFGYALALVCGWV